MKKSFPTFIDEGCRAFEQITVSAGVRGAQLLVNVDELVNFVKAKICVQFATGVLQQALYFPSHPHPQSSSQLQRRFPPRRNAGETPVQQEPSQKGACGVWRVLENFIAGTHVLAEQMEAIMAGKLCPILKTTFQ